MGASTKSSIADLVAQAKSANARGDFDAARAACDAIFAQDAGNLAGLQAYAVATKFAADDPHLPKLETALAHTQLPDDVRSQVGFILGKARADFGDLEGAFAAFEMANALKPELRYDPAAVREQAERITRMALARPTASTGGLRAIFVIGLPRSGTSLVASALGAHPAIRNLGERTALGEAVKTSGHFALPLGLIRDQRMTAHLLAAYKNDMPPLGAAQAFVDKMPENYWFAGVIPQLFPGALVIHMQRPRLANLWSLWRNDFGAGHHYAYRLPWLLAQYETYEVITNHWREVLGNAWIDLALEDVAQNPRAALEPLLTQADLPWDDACLLRGATDEEINTVSKWQVRQGISPTIAGDWKRFEPLIKERWAKALTMAPFDQE